MDNWTKKEFYLSQVIKVIMPWKEGWEKCLSCKVHVVWVLLPSVLGAWSSQHHLTSCWSFHLVTLEGNRLHNAWNYHWQQGKTVLQLATVSRGSCYTYNKNNLLTLQKRNKIWFFFPCNLSFKLSLKTLVQWTVIKITNFISKILLGLSAIYYN